MFAILRTLGMFVADLGTHIYAPTGTDTIPLLRAVLSCLSSGASGHILWRWSVAVLMLEVNMPPAKRGPLEQCL